MPELANGPPLKRGDRKVIGRSSRPVGTSWSVRVRIPPRAPAFDEGPQDEQGKAEELTPGRLEVDRAVQLHDRIVARLM